MATAPNIQNRTVEFNAILSDIGLRDKNNHSNQRSSLLSASQRPSPSPVAQRSEFSRKARDVANTLHNTMGKLQRLTSLAQRKSWFDDKPVEISELTAVVQQDIKTITLSLDELSKLLPSSKYRDKRPENNEVEHNTNVVELLRTRVRLVGAQFKDTLETRTRNVLATKTRRENYQVLGASTATIGHPPGRTDSPLYQLAAAAAASSSSSISHVSNGAGLDLLPLEPSGPSALMRNLPGDQQLVMMEAGQQTSSYIQDRASEIDRITSHIEELGSVFVKLASMVTEQGEELQRIDANAYDTQIHIEGAQRELLKIWTRMSGNRWLAAKMFGVLMIFFLLWVLISG